MNFINEMYGGSLDEQSTIEDIDNLFPPELFKNIREAIVKWDGNDVKDWKNLIDDIMSEYEVAKLEVNYMLEPEEQFYIDTASLPTGRNPATQIEFWRAFANPVVRYLSTFNLDSTSKELSRYLSRRKIHNIQLRNIILAYYFYGYTYVDGEDGSEHFILTSTQLITEINAIANIGARSTDIDNMKLAAHDLILLIKRYNTSRSNPLQGTLSQIHLFHYLIDTPFYKKMRQLLCQRERSERWIFYKNIFTNPVTEKCLFDELGSGHETDLDNRSTLLKDNSSEYSKIVTIDGHGRFIWRIADIGFTKEIKVADIDYQNNLWHYMTLPLDSVIDGNVRKIIDTPTTFYYLNFSGLGGINEHKPHIDFIKDKTNRLMISFSVENKGRGGKNHLGFAYYLNQEYHFNLLTNRTDFFTMGTSTSVKNYNDIFYTKAEELEINIEDNFEKYIKKIEGGGDVENKYLRYKLKYLLLKNKFSNFLK